MRVIIHLIWRFALRLTLALAVSVSLTLPLGFVFAAQRTFDLSAYPADGQRSLATIEVAGADIPRVIEDFGPEAYTAAQWELPLRNKSGKQSNVIALVSATGDNPGFLTTATLISAVTVSGDNWIDLSADVAYRLGVSPGDVVSAGEPAESGIDLTVRAVHAARLDGYPDIAQIPLGVALPLVPSADYQSILIAPMSPAEVDQKLATDFYVDRLIAGGYPGVDPAQSFVDVHEQKATASMTGLGLVLGTAVLAAIAGVAILLRESWIFARSIAPLAHLLADLGMSPDALLSRVSALGAAASACGVFVGSIIALVPYRLGFLAPGLPPSLAGAWVAAVAGLVLVSSATVALTLWRVVRSYR